MEFQDRFEGHSRRNEDRDREEVYSTKVRAGKRTYFFDVKETKGNDYYLVITESKKRHEDGSFTKHKIFLYKEDFYKFLNGLADTIDYIKDELMPDYDFDEEHQDSATQLGQERLTYPNQIPSAVMPQDNFSQRDSDYPREG